MTRKPVRDIVCTPEAEAQVRRMFADVIRDGVNVIVDPNLKGGEFKLIDKKPLRCKGHLHDGDQQTHGVCIACGCDDGRECMPTPPESDLVNTSESWAVQFMHADGEWTDIRRVDTRDEALVRLERFAPEDRTRCRIVHRITIDIIEGHQ